MGSGSDGGGALPLFETKEAKFKNAYRLFLISMFIGICMIWVYRITQILFDDDVEERLVWMLLFLSELWFGFYWVITKSARWNRVYRYAFRDRLSHRYEDKLPRVDIFVCTADPTIEPPMMVINTVLSVMAYNYPTDKLSVYLSDDGGSDLTFYALLEASVFSKHWLPFCKKFNIEPRSPAAYFSTKSNSVVDVEGLSSIKKLYEEMEHRIDTAANLGRIPEEIRTKHKGFSEWVSVTSQRDHQTILQVLIDGRNPNAVDIDGVALPMLVYLSRQKSPNHPHNFKAGAMNALLRVSSKISNGKIILNVDCDMYSNNSESVRDALCFFMDEQKSHDIAFVQFPQSFYNLTKNDIYGSSLSILTEVELPGMDGCGGPLYIGTGCFHRREVLCGKKYGTEFDVEYEDSVLINKVQEGASKLEETAKIVADCTFEEGTQWGKEMGLKYGCAVEDVITGLSIHCRGWKSVYFNPTRKGFLGVAPITLGQTLVQYKRWAEGNLQMLLSRYGPLQSYGVGRIKLGHRMVYCLWCIWAPNWLATLYYSVIPSLYLLKGIPLFPRISSLWFLPFAYVIITEILSSIGEFLFYGSTLGCWWNEQRMWIFRSTTSYLFGFIDTLLNLFGFAKSRFDITAKLIDKDVAKRKDIMEFGNSSPMFIILATLAMLNLYCFFWGVKRMIINTQTPSFDSLFLQVLLCGFLVIINLPIYNGLFFRKDNGRMPTSVTVKSIILAVSVCFFIM
ncbi:hypothetical protein AQUCO_09300038v1 [Aquilegia coerulea]|uniref:Glycosyltransferase 2-like domain-containing protein n=1 Tax=Aquilegia coerulea TaxID=218851 RepID=A0A2G5C6M4_AQUCA|nr:hypothetical protein AQUCO_09300038v1 [Aquilegia coerulea]